MDFRLKGSFLERHRTKVGVAICIGCIGGCFSFFRWRVTSIFRGSVLKTNPNLDGKTVVITERRFVFKNTGYYAAKEFASRGAKVYIVVQEPLTVQHLLRADVLKEQTRNEEIHLCPVDLGSLQSIQKFCNDFRKECRTVDYLINNADAYRIATEQTDEDYPKRFVVNYLGRALLTQNLMECVNRSAHGKILNVNQMIFPWHSRAVQYYAGKQSGSFNFLLANKGNYKEMLQHEGYSYHLLNANKRYVTEMAKRLRGTNTTINQVEMLMLMSAVLRIPLQSQLVVDHVLFYYQHTKASGGKLIAYAALAEEFDNKSGVVINGSDIAEPIQFDDSGAFLKDTNEVLEMVSKTTFHRDNLCD